MFAVVFKETFKQSEKPRNVINAETIRPKTLDELIGQEQIKQKLRVSMGAAMQRGEPLPHVLLTSSGGGLGKSSLANIISNEMLSPLLSTTGQCILSTRDLRNWLMKLEPNSILLIDEAHCIGRLAAEELLLVVEENILNVTLQATGPMRFQLPPWTLILASTKPECFSAPLVQRFPLQLHLDYYSVSELEQIVEGMMQRMTFEFDEQVHAEIAKRGKGIPRIALRLCERVRDVAQARCLQRAGMNEFDMAMQIEGIDGLGLNRQERHYLRVLALAEPRPIGVRNLSLALGMSTQTVADVLEPVLVRLGMISIGAGGRRLTDQGRQHLETVGDKYD